jgi:CheY-like chemotaxis protein
MSLSKDWDGVILLVEREVVTRNLIANMLHRQGYLVLAAAHGYEALELSRTYEGRIDLLIADAEMSKLSGQELCERVKRQRPEIGLLLISSNHSDGAPNDGERLPFLRKPFGATELREKMNEMLPERLS